VKNTFQFKDTEIAEIETRKEMNELASGVQADPSDRLNRGGQNFDEAERDRNELRYKEIEYLRSAILEMEQQRAQEREYFKSIIDDLKKQQLHSRKELQSQFVEKYHLGP
jgi:hypothetical protein